MKNLNKIFLLGFAVLVYCVSNGYSQGVPKGASGEAEIGGEAVTLPGCQFNTDNIPQNGFYCGECFNCNGVPKCNAPTITTTGSCGAACGQCFYVKVIFGVQIGYDIVLKNLLDQYDLTGIDKFYLLVHGDSNEKIFVKSYTVSKEIYQGVSVNHIQYVPLKLKN